MPTPFNPLTGARHELKIGTLTLHLDAVEDVDTLLDHYIETVPGDVDQIPYYALLWPAALALAQRLYDSYRNALPTRRLLELGCGLGLPSLVASALGADVLATDFHPDNQPHFERNALLNALPVRYRCLAWSEPVPWAAYDWVIGSDLLYERRHIPDLVHCATAHCRPGGTILLADPGRDGLGETVEAFEARGWRAAETIHDETFVIAFRRHAPPTSGPAAT